MMPEPAGYYDTTESRIPDRIRVSFSDGSTALYDLHTDLPAPLIVENIKIIKKWKEQYVNQPARRRRRK